MWRAIAVYSLHLSSQPSTAIVAIRERLSLSQLPRARRSISSLSATSISSSNNTGIHVSQPKLSLLSSSSSAPVPLPLNVIKNPPELALLSLLFVLSTAIGAIFSLAVISIPTMIALKKLAVSADKLSKIVSEEVHGTLSSLKLSCVEINDLTQQLSNLRQKISGSQYAKKSRSNKRSSSATRNYPIVD